MHSPFLIVVRFQLSQGDYRSREDEKFIPAVISKNMRLANPVTLLVTPYTIAAAEESGQPLPLNTPDDDDPYSSNRAKGMYSEYLT